MRYRRSVDVGTADGTFSKADIDNNIPQGDAVPLMLMANFIHEGQQKQLTSTALVRVIK